MMDFKHRRNRQLPVGLAVLTVWLWLCPMNLQAVTILNSVDVSADITVGLSGLMVADDENVIEDDLAGTIMLSIVGSIPGEADLDAYHLLPNGDRLFSLDITAALPGSLIAAPCDVVRFDGVAYTLELHGIDEGLPADADIDAVGTVGASDLLLSFSDTVSVGGMTVEDEDLVRFNGVTFSLFFDGSAAGVDGALDLDAVHHLDPNGHLLFSFDGSGALGGVDFNDEDLLEYDPEGDSWEMSYDGSAQHGWWPPGDLDAVYASPAVAGAVPDGDDVPGAQLHADKTDGSDGKDDGNDITLTWGASCLASDADYAVYEGLVGDFTSHVPTGWLSCTTGGATTATITPGSGNRYYLVVPQGEVYEGSYGTDSEGDQRPPSTRPCKPQLVGSCD